VAGGKGYFADIDVAVGIHRHSVRCDELVCTQAGTDIAEAREQSALVRQDADRGPRFGTSRFTGMVGPISPM